MKQSLWLVNETFCRSQWPRCQRRGSAAAYLLGLQIRIPLGAKIYVSFECCVLSGWGTCDGLITRPEESYRAWCVQVWSWNIDNERPWLLCYGRGRELQNCTFGQIYHKILSVFRFSSAIMSIIALWILKPLTLVYWHQLLIVLTLPVS
jgi:hypothetical protein